MSGRLLCAVVLCLFFTAILSLRCYTNTDKGCMLLPDMTDCGKGETCQCASYRAKCTEGDQACTKSEISSGAMKQMNVFISKTTCEAMQKGKSMYSDVVCCSKNKCNKPSNLQCTEF